MLKEVIDLIVHWDQVAWFYLNTQWHSPFFDEVIPYLRNQWFWMPLYFFLFIFMPVKFRKKGFIWCLAFLVTFSLSDQLSAHLLKPIFHRLRPCNNPYLGSIVHLLVPCGSGYSFPSSHASNHFALGIFGAVTLESRAKWIWPVAILWALSVSFAQVYVGVHYPLDVTCGALLGISVGLFTGKLFNRQFGLTNQ